MTLKRKRKRKRKRTRPRRRPRSALDTEAIAALGYALRAMDKKLDTVCEFSRAAVAWSTAGHLYGENEEIRRQLQVTRDEFRLLQEEEAELRKQLNLLRGSQP